MSEQTYLLHLDGMDVPDGEITFAALGELAQSLQLLVTRIGRLAGQIDGPGRTPAGIESACTLRLIALQEGSTGLAFALGDTDTLPEMPDEIEMRDRFEEIFAGIAANAVPGWVSPLVSEAAGQVAASLKSTGANTFSLDATGARVQPVTPGPVATDVVDSTIWKTPEPHPDTEDLVVAGRLEAVDLKAGRFRVRDDVGNEVRLDDVVDIDAAARLIGSRVVATGVAERDARNRVRLVGPVVAAEVLPVGWLAEPSRSTGLELTIPDAAVAGVTDAEIEEFLQELRR